MAEPGRGAQGRDGVEGPLLVVARYSGLGLQLAGSVGMFMAGGWWLDGKLATMPLLTIIGALGGGAAGFYSIYRQLVKDRSERPPGS